MPIKKLVTDANLGYNVNYNATLNKLEINIDDSTLTTDANGVISVDPTALGIVVVSVDGANIITGSNTTGAFLNKDTVKTIVGEMVASSTDGIDYDALAMTLKAYLASLAVTDSTSVDLTIVEDTNADGVDGDVSISASVKISPTANNAITIDAVAGGLFVPAIPATTNVHTLDTTNGKFKTTVDGVVADTDLVQFVGLDSSNLGYAFA